MSGSETAAEALDGLSLGELRRELHKLVVLAETGERPQPDAVLDDRHPMGPGREWRVDYRQHDVWDRGRLWSVLTRESDEVRGCVYIHTPDSMVGDYICSETTEARQLAMALLAACDRADHLAAGVAVLADRRRKP